MSSSPGEPEPETIPESQSAPVQELTLPGGGQLSFSHRAAEDGEDSYDGMVSVLTLRIPDMKNQEVAVLPYGPDHPYWGEVSLAPFEDVMGLQGFTLSYPGGASWSSIDYYEMAENTDPNLVVSCTNTAWSVELNGDGQTELLSGYGMEGYLDLNWREEPFLYSCSLNETARVFLDLPLGTWVSLQMTGQGERSDLVTARWSSSEGGRLAVPDRSRELSLGELFSFERSRTEFWDQLSLPTPDGTLMVVLQEELWDRYCFRTVSQIQVFQGETLLQTITPPQSLDDSGHLYEGLFVNHGYNTGEPDLRDINFDDWPDLGLMAVNSYPHNVSYCYFLWDSEHRQFSSPTLFFAFPELDEEQQLMIEGENRGTGFYQYDFFRWTEDRTLQLVRREQEIPAEEVDPSVPVTVLDSQRPSSDSRYVAIYEPDGQGHFVLVSQELRPA